MNRRDFLVGSSATSLAMVLPWGASSQARAQSLRYQGPYFINLLALGGWDPTFTFDPKTNIGTTAFPAMNKLAEGKTIQRLTPNGAPFIEHDFMEPSPAMGVMPLRMISMRDFMTRVSSRFVVLNGIDTATNNHEVGQQLLGCGRSNEVLPAFAALAAARVAAERDVPLAFVGAGGFEYTGDLVSLSRLSPSALSELAFPERLDVSNAASATLERSVVSKVLEARNKSLNAQLDAAAQPRTKAALSALRDARRRTSSLQLITNALPRNAMSGQLQLVQAADYFPHLEPHRAYFGDLTAAMQQAELTMLAFREGLAVSANMYFGQFDTHADHDVQQQRQAGRLFLLLRYLFEKADALGISQSLYLTVTSDFGRTPGYNANNGKDHWNVTSALLSAPSAVLGTAGQVVGGSDEQHRPLAVTATGATVAMPSSSATRLKALHLHRTLRQAFGLAGSDLDRKYGLPADPVSVPLLQRG
jgi:uncharacterized protein (DUF1501 family)